MIFLQVGNRIATVTQIVTNIQTHTDTRVQIFRMFPNVRCIRISLDIGSVQMDRIIEVVLFHFLVHIGQKFVIRYADNRFHAYSFRIFKTTIYFSLALHIDRTDSISSHTIRSAFVMESLDLIVIAIQRQVKILDTKIMNIQTLQSF